MPLLYPILYLNSAYYIHFFLQYNVMVLQAGIPKDKSVMYKTWSMVRGLHWRHKSWQHMSYNKVVLWDVKLTRFCGYSYHNKTYVILCLNDSMHNPLTKQCVWLDKLAIHCMRFVSVSVHRTHSNTKLDALVETISRQQPYCYCVLKIKVRCYTSWNGILIYVLTLKTMNYFTKTHWPLSEFPLYT